MKCTAVGLVTTKDGVQSVACQLNQGHGECHQSGSIEGLVHWTPPACPIQGIRTVCDGTQPSNMQQCAKHWKLNNCA